MSGPNGLPDDFPEDNHNYRYTSMQTIRVGKYTEEKWNIKIEYSGNAIDDLDIVDWAYNKTLPGFMLQEEVDEHIARSNSRANTTISHDEFFNITSSTYMLHDGFENGRYWWDILEVQLQPLESYGVQNPACEKDSMEDLAIWGKQALDMARKSRGGFTDEEVEETEQRNERLGILKGEDFDEDEIMGVE